jgi:tRNA pseudouridine38-40 synthase
MSDSSSRLVALWCWYHGEAFRGYQAQADGPTVQSTLWAALRHAGFDRNPIQSARTDAGVHARMQVLGLRVAKGLAPGEILARLNPLLAPHVGLCLVAGAPPKFNPAWRASGKEYRYRIALAPVPGWSSCAWHQNVDASRLADAIGRCAGTRDFSAFHHPSSTVRLRTVSAASLHELASGLVEVRLRGDAFARYQVRTLVGTAVAVARGEVPEAAYLAALEEGLPLKRVRAPAEGLVLWEVFFPPPLDPFSAQERREAPLLPAVPPFVG